MNRLGDFMEHTHIFYVKIDNSASRETLYIQTLPKCKHIYLYTIYLLRFKHRQHYSNVKLTMRNIHIYRRLDITYSVWQKLKMCLDFPFAVKNTSLSTF